MKLAGTVAALLCAPSFGREILVEVGEDISGLLSAAQDGDVFTLQQGRHFAKKTIEINAKNVRIEGNSSEISGGFVIPPSVWKQGSKAGLWQADVSSSTLSDVSPRQLYINGVRCQRASAGSGPVSLLGDKSTQRDFGYSISSDKADQYNIGSWGNDTEFIYRYPQWSESRCTVDHINKQGSDIEVHMTQPCFSIMSNKPCNQGSKTPYDIENTGLVNSLTEGQFYLDRDVSYKPRTLYFFSSSIDPRKAEAISPKLDVVLLVANTTNVTWSGVTFEHGAYNVPNSDTGFVEQQSGALVLKPDPSSCNSSEWYPMPSNIVVEHSSVVLFDRVTVRHMGAGGIQTKKGCQHVTIQNSNFYDISGTAVQVGAYNTFAESNPNDQELYTVIHNNTITNVAAEFRGTCGVQGGYTAGTQITHNDMFNLPYSGVSLGWGWARVQHSYAANNTISYNNVTQFKRQMGDGGALYVLGPQPNSQMKGNYVSSSTHIQKDGGGYYPDEGSAYWHISDCVYTAPGQQLEWLHVWTKSIHDIVVDNCFTDTLKNETAGTNCSYSNITLVPDGQSWPPAAVAIMKNAGTLPPSQ
eukprot:TRINITY_DN1349_c7_g1_i1.p1 TRINITY_DN1349_c7_g1~~TRINITY_DN1349_c7_g1_i1.p1  ORF type:complete len:603 (+),score=133.05 TRINITY_DN1349_c7_g1_i1:64-1809(+)